jgi:hypothetical protein
MYTLERKSDSRTGNERDDAKRSPGMKTLKFTYWKDGEYFLGFLNDYPDYETQGASKDELVSNLRSLLTDIESGQVPYIRKVEELVVSE